MNYINRSFLTRYDSFNQFINKKNNETTIIKQPTEDDQQTPLELIIENHNMLQMEYITTAKFSMHAYE